MNLRQRVPITTLIVALAAFIGSGPVLAIAAEEADETEAKRVAAQKFDATFFDSNRDASVEVAQTRLNIALKKRIESVDRIYDLSDAQRLKLELAGRGSIKNFFDALTAQKLAFLAEVRDDLTMVRYLYGNPDVLALRRQLRNGPFEEESLFGKSLRNVLTPEQATQSAARITRAKDSGRTITAANVVNLVRIAQFQKDVYRVEWDRDGKQVGLLEYNKQLDVYPPLAEQPVRSLGAGQRVLGFDFGPDANTIATVDFSANLTVHDIADGKELLIPLGSMSYNVKFSPDGKLLVTAGYGTTAFLWNAANGECIREFALGRQEGGLTPAFSPDGKVLAVGNRNSTTGLFEVSSGKLLHELPRRSSHDLRFDPTGATLAVVYVNGQLVLWDVQTGQVKKSVHAWSDELYTVDWTPDGSLLVTGGYNSRLTFWNPADLSIVAEFDSPEWIMNARFSPDGTKLILSGQNRGLENRYVVTWAVP